MFSTVDWALGKSSAGRKEEETTGTRAGEQEDQESVDPPRIRLTSDIHHPLVLGATTTPAISSFTLFYIPVIRISPNLKHDFVTLGAREVTDTIRWM